MYHEQNSLCLVCKAPMDKRQLSSHSSELHIHRLVSTRNTANKIKLNKKFYKSRKNKILLHKKCHLNLHKNKTFQSSSFFRTLVEKKPIV